MTMRKIGAIAGMLAALAGLATAVQRFRKANEATA